jgi:hypothetical protein
MAYGYICKIPTGSPSLRQGRPAVKSWARSEQNGACACKLPHQPRWRRPASALIPRAAPGSGTWPVRLQEAGRSVVASRRVSVDVTAATRSAAASRIDVAQGPGDDRRCAISRHLAGCVSRLQGTSHAFTVKDAEERVHHLRVAARASRVRCTRAPALSRAKRPMSVLAVLLRSRARPKVCSAPTREKFMHAVSS